MPPYDWALLGDLTNDGTVQLFELEAWSEHFLVEGDSLPPAYLHPFISPVFQ